ncbi:TetR/AcrR family transcriptional regulator [Nocardioides speluncae]|uniref:TetR/AcrR family transcriptional regulator n=1 Tax=Nocardioides speluncae TaxID=2670337 RepID=UPI000D688768|nr:TetR/AcrR family transcriptional regulator [Nocardioides speluncae]
MSNTAERGWAGTTKAERQSARQARIRAAGYELITVGGTSAVTVRSVCRQAGLTDRYFYESFESRDALLAAMFLESADAVHHALTEVIEQHHGDPVRLVEALQGVFEEHILDDPAKGRLLLLDSLTEPALAGVSLAAVPAFTRLVQTQLPTDAPRAQRAMTAVGLMGALAALLSSWFAGTLRVSREELVQHCTKLLLGAPVRPM